MKPENTMPPPRIEWDVAARPLPGQTVSGDLHVVRSLEDAAFLAAVDGIGHGTEAIAAAQITADILQRNAAAPLISLVERCHQALLKTRGVVMTLATIRASDSTLTWLGVGNVEAWLLRADPGAQPARASVLLRGGLVGYQLPPLQTSIVPIGPGDLLLFATDGIRPEFAAGIDLRDPPKQIAHRILAEHFKGTDDALVLAARYLGPGHET